MSGQAWVRNTALVVPLLLVNAAAIYGQVMWADDHLERIGIWGAIGFACALESIGIFLAAEAHASLMAGDSSARLRLGSYAVASLVGVLNYAHFAPSLTEPTPQALAFGAMSVISPWLWSIRSRSMSRAQLREQGLIDGRAVKFTAAQWAMYPRWSFWAFRAAVWRGETNPDKARGLIEAGREVTGPVLLHLMPTVHKPEEWKAELVRTAKTTGEVAHETALAQIAARVDLGEFSFGEVVTMVNAADWTDDEIIDAIDKGITPAQLIDGAKRSTPLPPVPAVSAASEARSQVSAPISTPEAPEPAEQPVEPPPVKVRRPPTTTRAPGTGRATGASGSPAGKSKAREFFRSEVANGRIPSGPEIAKILGASRKTGTRYRASWADELGVEI